MSIATRTGDGGGTAVSTAQFSNAWWFRKEFEATPEQAGGCAGLIFEGINCRANIWLNGARIAPADETFSAFRIFNLEITGRLKPGKNVMAVEVLPPHKAVIKNGKHQPHACERQSPVVHHASPGLASHFRNRSFCCKILT